jgi:hypothetical protein
MGVDIAGWVEVKPEYYDPPSHLDFDRQWVGVVSHLGFLVGRDYDAFGCLFGVKNAANFLPLAAERGIPDDASPEVRGDIARYGEEAFSASWVTWAELRAMDWEEEGVYADSALHQYIRDEHGQLVYDTKATWSRPFAEHVLPPEEVEPSLYAAILSPEYPVYPEGQEWEIDGVVYRAEKLRRKDALGDAWRMVFGMMAALAARYGDDGVRLVVWFSW